MITYPNVKLNLGLRILRKRPDGYHDIDTLFFPCDRFRDTLEIISGDDWSRTSASLFARYTRPGQLAQGISQDGRLMITLAREEGIDWDPLRDLTARAHALLSADFDLPPMKIFLEKGSPVGAGLGGGSADAAFALRMMAELSGLTLSEEDLAAYAARLGSDCAFFVYNRPMFGSGRGEVLSDAPAGLLPPDRYRIEVTVPEGISVTTAEAEAGIVPGVPEVTVRDVVLQAPEKWKELLFNDFETTVFARHPSLAGIKQAYYKQGALYASMSGSGSAVYGIFRI